MTSSREAIRRKLPELIIDSGLILFSVLLALFLNEYRSQRNEDRLKAEAMFKVQNEIRSNLEITEEWFEYHREVLSNLQNALGDETVRSTVFTEDGVRFWGLMPRGVVQRLIDDAAWQALKSSSTFSNLDFETMMNLSKIYKLQEEGVESTIRVILNILSSREALDQDQVTNTLILLHNAFGELVSQEDFLIRQFRSTLKELDGDSET